MSKFHRARKLKEPHLRCLVHFISTFTHQFHRKFVALKLHIKGAMSTGHNGGTEIAGIVTDTQRECRYKHVAVTLTITETCTMRRELSPTESICPSFGCPSIMNGHGTERCVWWHQFFIIYWTSFVCALFFVVFLINRIFLFCVSSFWQHNALYFSMCGYETTFGNKSTPFRTIRFQTIVYKKVDRRYQTKWRETVVNAMLTTDWTTRLRDSHR